MVAEVASKASPERQNPEIKNDKALSNGGNNVNNEKKRSEQKLRRRTKKKSRKQREEAKANVSELRYCMLS
jgi:hypothetical protein